MRVSLQRQMVAKISSKTVSIKPTNATAWTVYFLGVELGQVRPLNGGWGWRTKRADHACKDKQEAAQAFADWVLRRHWECYQAKFEVTAVVEEL
jgi:hypothetical protein